MRRRGGAAASGRRGRTRPDTPPDPVIPFADLIVALRRAPGPVTVPSLARAADLESSEEGALRRQLEYLENQGIVFSQRRGRWSLHSRARIVVGRVASPDGTYGFVSPEDGSRGDLHVPGRRLAGARHGDLVLSRVIRSARDGGRRERGDSGEVIAVLERRAPFVAGLYRREGDRGVVTPRDARVAGSVVVGEDRRGEGRGRPADGSVVWVEITSPEDRFRPARGRVLSVLGRPDDPRAAEATVIRMHDLPDVFPEAVEREARRAAAPITDRDRAGRADFRGSPVVTVDPESARDHDDAVSLEQVRTDRGLIDRLAVHIADVSHYVAVGGAIDPEARRRGTSIYFPGRCIPMLPEPLSSGICSLVPGEDRLVQSVIMDFDAHGRRVAFRFADGVIRSAACLSYGELQRVLDGEEAAAAGAPAGMLRAMGRLSERLRAKRLGRGSLDLDLPETEVILDAEGRPVDARPVPHGPAHRVIEEFMLAANETVARHLRGSLPASLYRIHEDPDPGEIDEAEEALRRRGLAIRSTRGAPAARLAAILGPFRGRPEETAVATTLLRALKLARYSHHAIGHFGLAAPLYTHFTSPIRRYPDLVVHRLLRASRAGEAAAADRRATLEAVATECSRLERRAEEAERAVRAWLIAIWMAGRVGEPFHGTVTGITAGALFVTLEPSGVEGIVPLADRRDRAGSRRGAVDGPVLGESLRVRIQAVDPFRGKVLLKPLSTG